jgi:NADH:ubiquinone oxidoreductase subunit B-like Fe-S oxidoreductase
MRPLMTPRFDAYRYGIQWRPTPRQANLFVISGYLSVKTLKRVIRSYEQMQNPKYVVGLGSCTINGGMYFDSYNTITRLDEYLPVDVYITGCMPRPEALLQGFEELKRLIRAGKGEGANHLRRELRLVQGEPEARDPRLGHAGLQLVEPCSHEPGCKQELYDSLQRPKPITELYDTFSSLGELGPSGAGPGLRHRAAEQLRLAAAAPARPGGLHPPGAADRGGLDRGRHASS